MTKTVYKTTRTTTVERSNGRANGPANGKRKPAPTRRGMFEIIGSHYGMSIIDGCVPDSTAAIFKAIFDSQPN